MKTYVNVCQTNGGGVVPAAGNADDEPALDRLGEIFCGREVGGVSAPVLVYGGIHCVTKQVPAGMRRCAP